MALKILCVYNYESDHEVKSYGNLKAFLLSLSVEVFIGYATSDSSRFKVALTEKRRKVERRQQNAARIHNLED